jgi:hypothetical protein
MLYSRGDLDRTAAASLREQAALARRLGRGVSSEGDRRKFAALADQLESEAAELEQGGASSAGRGVMPEAPARSARPYAA